MTQDPQHAWFDEARFGLFIHWGLYSLLGHGEWALQREAIPLEEYDKLAQRFDASAYDPTAWAALAKAAGMRYAVLTTKHHDGFCLWDSKLCQFNSTISAARRDLVGEFVEAFRAADLKVGLYYSLGDFRNPDWERGWRGDAAARERFMAWTHGIVEELMTGYGKIDILWYDLPQNFTAKEWKSAELNARVRQWQPGILINNRAYTAEDFGTPEREVVPAASGRRWEACVTLNENWGYVPSDLNFKTARDVAILLARCAEGGGNLLLNVGPEGSGRIPTESEQILRKVGLWLETHGESIYGSERRNLTWNSWGPTSVRGNRAWLFLHRLYEQTLTLGGVIPEVRSATMLGLDQKELKVTRRGRQILLEGLPASPPEILPVVRLELEAPFEQDLSEVIGGADIFPDLPN